MAERGGRSSERQCRILNHTDLQAERDTGVGFLIETTTESLAGEPCYFVIERQAGLARDYAGVAGEARPRDN